MIKNIVRWFKLIALLTYLLGMMVIGAWVWLENNVPVTVTYFGHQIENQTLGSVITGMLTIGFFLGFLLFLLVWLYINAAHKYRYKRASKELEKLRSGSVQG